MTQRHLMVLVIEQKGPDMTMRKIFKEIILHIEAHKRGFTTLPYHLEKPSVANE